MDETPPLSFLRGNSTVDKDFDVTMATANFISLFDIILYFFQFSSSDCRNSGYALWRDVALMFGIS